MPQQPRFPAFAALLLLTCVAGCTRQPPAKQAASLVAEITAIRAELPVDPTAAQADALALPTRRAEKAYAALLALAERNPKDAVVVAAQARAEPVYAEVRHIQHLATERHALADLMGGLKIRGYLATRAIIVPKLLSALAAAARQAAGTDLEKLPTLVRESAELAASLTGMMPAETAAGTAMASAPRLTRADWVRIAERIDSFNNNEPPEFALGLGLAYAVLGKSGFALVEFDRAATGHFDDPKHAEFVPLARAMVYSRLGFVELAAREAAGISGDTEQGRQLLAVAHACLAYFHTTEKNWKQADRELGLAVRAWPNNPLVVYLSGERLLADGRKEQALDTLARATAGSEAAWFAPLIESRIREVRDARGEVPPLVLNAGFIAKCALHAAIQQAEKTEAGRKLAGLFEAEQRLPSLLSATPTPSDNGK